jgi:hypothetical protein
VTKVVRLKSYLFQWCIYIQNFPILILIYRILWYLLRNSLLKFIIMKNMAAFDQMNIDMTMSISCKNKKNLSRRILWRKKYLRK